MFVSGVKEHKKKGKEAKRPTHTHAHNPFDHIITMSRASKPSNKNNNVDVQYALCFTPACGKKPSKVLSFHASIKQAQQSLADQLGYADITKGPFVPLVNELTEDGVEAYALVKKPPFPWSIRVLAAVPDSASKIKAYKKVADKFVGEQEVSCMMGTQRWWIVRMPSNALDVQRLTAALDTVVGGTGYVIMNGYWNPVAAGADADADEEEEAEDEKKAASKPEQQTASRDSVSAAAPTQSVRRSTRVSAVSKQ